MALRPARWLILCFLLLLWIPPLTAQGELLVYPQAVVGPLGETTFEIRLGLGNRASDPWTGVLSFRRQEDLSGMSNLTFTDSGGNSSLEPDGEHAVSLAPAESKTYTISSNQFQIGVLVVTPTGGSRIEDLVPSFFYQSNDQSGLGTDLIPITGLTEASLGFRALISETDSFRVGVAVVSRKGIIQGGNPEVDVEVKAILQNGAENDGAITLGGDQSGQKAVFPREVLSLPASVPIAQLLVTSEDLLYVTVLGLGQPDGFRNVRRLQRRHRLRRQHDCLGAGYTGHGADLGHGI